MSTIAGVLFAVAVATLMVAIILGLLVALRHPMAFLRRIAGGLLLGLCAGLILAFASLPSAVWDITAHGGTWEKESHLFSYFFEEVGKFVMGILFVIGFMVDAARILSRMIKGTHSSA